MDQPPSGGIPLCPGLTVVTAVSQPEGDYESIKTVGSVDAGAVRLRYSTEIPAASANGGQTRTRLLLLDRRVRLADQRTATLYLQQFQTNLPVEVPGTTAIGVSSAVLTALKTKGDTKLGVAAAPPAIPGGGKLSVDPKDPLGVFNYFDTYTLQRVEPVPVMLPVVINDLRTEVPAIHAMGHSDFYGYKAEFYFLDDELNPLSLRFRLGIGAARARGQQAGGDRDVLRVVKITSNCNSSTSGADRLEQRLLETGRADIYDIYFNFNSDQIRDESEPTLREINTVMRRHPDWKLSINGHTDNIAGDNFNLDLSIRRAAAVKTALVSGFGINGERLTATGHGKSQPVDTNDTPEGRARNRRVELVRQPG